MKIRKLNYNEIDFDKYRNCFETSIQYHYSASLDYLNICVENQWDLLIFEDYKAVMPVAFVKKFGFKFVIRPILCQQLGVFSKIDSPKLNEAFLTYLLKNYFVKQYAFNQNNELLSVLNKRKNYLLPSEAYTTIKNWYSPKRKRKLRINTELSKKIKLKNINFSTSLGFLRTYILGAESYKNLMLYENLFKKFYVNGNLVVKGFFVDDELCNLILLYQDARTVVLMGLINNPDKKQYQGASILVDSAISEYIDSKTFDFEGSDLPNIEEFFRGFSPLLKTYPTINFSNFRLLWQRFIHLLK